MTNRKLNNEVYVVHMDGMRVDHGTFSAVTMTLNNAKKQLENYVSIESGLIFRKEGGHYSGNNKFKEQISAIKKRIADRFEIIVYKPSQEKYAYNVE